MGSYHRMMCWTLIYSANLITPLMMGSSEVSGWAWVGLILAILIYWVAGLFCCGKSREMTWVLIIGGIVVGFSQFYPFFQLITGVLALRVESWLRNAAPTPHNGSITTLNGGFIATFMTGTLLIGVVIVIGVISRGYWRLASVGGKRKPDLDPEIDRP